MTVNIDALMKLANSQPHLSVQGHCVWTAVVDIQARLDWGLGPQGERFCVPIAGGVFWGAPGFESLHGTIRTGGADRQLLRPDGVKELEAIYEMQTHDQAVISVCNRVIIDDDAPGGRYAKSVICVTAPLGPHAWLNRRLFVGTLQSLQPTRAAVLIRSYMI